MLAPIIAKAASRVNSCEEAFMILKKHHVALIGLWLIWLAVVLMWESSGLASLRWFVTALGILFIITTSFVLGIARGMENGNYQLGEKDSPHPGGRPAGKGADPRDSLALPRFLAGEPIDKIWEDLYFPSEPKQAVINKFLKKSAINLLKRRLKQQAKRHTKNLPKTP